MLLLLPQQLALRSLSYVTAKQPSVSWRHVAPTLLLRFQRGAIHPTLLDGHAERPTFINSCSHPNHYVAHADGRHRCLGGYCQR